MEKAFKRAIDCIIAKDDTKAKALIKKAISKHPKMKLYKNKLQEMGLDLKKIDVPDELINSIKNMLKDYDKPAQLKILDMLYKKVAITDDK